MCQATEDDLSGVLNSKPDFKNFRKCLKCEKNSVVVTRICEALCRECFMEYFTHKFRATIGKHKIINKDEEVLFAYSGSSSSVAMLDLLAKGTSDEAFLKKRFTFKPTLLFIEDHNLFNKNGNNQTRKEFIQSVLNTMEFSKFNIYFSLIENSVDENPAFYDNIEKLEFNDTKRTSFLDLVTNIKSDTSREEFIKRMRMKLINHIAKEIRIKKIVFALSCSKLTVDLLSNVAMGKGAHISAEMALEEKHSDLIYLRPLREVTSKEITFYNHFSGKDDSIISSNSSLSNLPNSTIYRLTEKFINGVQNDFPTTVATIFRTSDKLVPFEDTSSTTKVETICTLCECKVDTNNNGGLSSSAISDLSFSKSISKIDSSNIEREESFENLCYSCSTTISDIKNKSNLPKLLALKTRTEMKDEIKEFLLEA